MIEIVDDFINKLRGIAPVQTDPLWAERINNLEVVLHALFVSDEAQAIEMSDQVGDIIGRKRVSIGKRMSMVQEILHEGFDEWSPIEATKRPPIAERPRSVAG